MKVFVVMGGECCGGEQSAALGVSFSREAAQAFIDRIKEYEANNPEPQLPRSGRVRSVVHDSGKIARYVDGTQLTQEELSAHRAGHRAWAKAHPAGGDGYTSNMCIEEFDTIDELTVTVDLSRKTVAGET